MDTELVSITLDNGTRIAFLALEAEDLPFVTTTVSKPKKEPKP